VGGVGVGWRDGLELDESSKILHSVEVDAHVLPEEQAPGGGGRHNERRQGPSG
jgi:hypothetical protein